MLTKMLALGIIICSIVLSFAIWKCKFSTEYKITFIIMVVCSLYLIALMIALNY